MFYSLYNVYIIGGGLLGVETWRFWTYPGSRDETYPVHCIRDFIEYFRNSELPSMVSGPIVTSSGGAEGWRRSSGTSVCTYKEPHLHTRVYVYAHVCYGVDQLTVVRPLCGETNSLWCEMENGSLHGRTEVVFGVLWVRWRSPRDGHTECDWPHTFM